MKAIKSGDEFLSKTDSFRMGLPRAFKVYRAKVVTRDDVSYEWRWVDGEYWHEGGRKVRFKFEQMIGKKLIQEE